MGDTARLVQGSNLWFMIGSGEHSVSQQRAEYYRQGRGRTELPNRSGMPSKLVEPSQILLHKSLVNTQSELRFDLRSPKD